MPELEQGALPLEELDACITEPDRDRSMRAPRVSAELIDAGSELALGIFPNDDVVVRDERRELGGVCFEVRRESGPFAPHPSFRVLDGALRVDRARLIQAEHGEN